MPEEINWSLENETVVKYEELFVPALFKGWAEVLVTSVTIPGQAKVLDIACGTGIVARTVKDRFNHNVRVTGLDAHPGMLQLARKLRHDIDWVDGNAQQLPFEKSSFDVVFCQAALMFFTDPVTALTEMQRVLRSGGKMAVQIWGNSEVYNILIDILDKTYGPETASVLNAPFLMKDPEVIKTLFKQAEIRSATYQTHVRNLVIPTVEAWLYTEIESWALHGKVSVEAILPQVTEACSAYVQDDGSIEIPMEGHIVVADKESI